MKKYKFLGWPLLVYRHFCRILHLIQWSHLNCKIIFTWNPDWIFSKALERHNEIISVVTLQWSIELVIMIMVINSFFTLLISAKARAHEIKRHCSYDSNVKMQLCMVFQTTQCLPLFWKIIMCTSWIWQPCTFKRSEHHWHVVHIEQNITF